MSDSSGKNNNDFGLVRPSQYGLSETIAFANFVEEGVGTVVAKEIMPSIGSKWGGALSVTRGVDHTPELT